MMLRFSPFSLLIILVFCTQALWAQKPTPTTTELLFHDDEDRLIFRGEVQRIFGDNNYSCQATILIDRVYRGDYQLDTVSVHTGPGRNRNIPDRRCLQVGDIVVFFASKIYYSSEKGHAPYTVFDRDNYSFVVPQDSTKEVDYRISDKLSILDQFFQLKDVKDKQAVQLTNAEGVVFAEGEWENGVPIGEWKHYTEFRQGYGEVMSTIVYEKGLIKQKETLSWFFQYDDKGRIILEQLYKKQGDKRYLSSEKTFEYDELNSIVTHSKEFLPDGVPKSVHTSRTFQGLFNSESSTVSNGYALHVDYSSQEKVEGHGVHGARTGVWRTYSKDGELIDEKDYGTVSVPEEGMYIAYRHDGNIRIKGLIDDQGRQTGKWELFFEDGSLQEVGFFEEGQRTGAWHTFSKRGILIVERRYKNGQLHGTYFFYDRNDGRLTTQGEYLNGKKVGIWKSYELGRLIVKEYNDEGQLHGKSKTYHSTGELAIESTYYNGLLNGWIRHYYEDGTVSKEREYRDGLPIGPGSTYDRLGRLVAQNEFLPDFFTGQDQMKIFTPKRQESIPKPTLNQNRTVSTLGVNKDSIEILGAEVDRFINVFGNSLFSTRSNGLLRIDVTTEELAAYSTPWPDSLLYGPSQYPPQMAFRNDTLSCLFRGGQSAMIYDFDVFRFYKNELISLNRFPMRADRGSQSRIADDGESLISYHQTNYDILIEKYNMRRRRITSTSPPIPNRPQERINWVDGSSFNANGQFAFFAFRDPRSASVYVGIENLATAAFEHFKFEVPRMLAENWSTTKVEHHSNIIYLLGHHTDQDSRKSIRGMYVLNCTTKQVDFLEWQDKLAPDRTFNPQTSKINTYFYNNRMYIVFNYDTNGVNEDKNLSPYRNIILEVDTQNLELGKMLDDGSNNIKYYFLVNGYWIEYIHYKAAIGQEQGRSVVKRFALTQ
ncbi:toxin-antitoxin system YwqK family antitoxin [Lewinella sp. LCG006]|uniref:toxin-antitoxin system YwqK family antitoxin n=1 Tax=Lewinella sp. LCG006 TaxID=3231911 RepID=UPI0034600D64